MDIKKWQDDFIKYINSNIQTDELLSSILPAGDLTIDESLRVYANDYRARLLEAMSKNYEMTWLVLGDDLFFDLAQEYIRYYPSSFKSLNFYGDKFSDFLKERNYLEYSEMARYEKAFWELFHDRDNSKNILTEETLLNGFFDLHKMFLFKSDWNLPFLWRKREDGISEEESGMIHFDELKYWVMLKMENKVEVLELNSNEYSFLVLLKEKKNIIEMNEALKAHNLNELTSHE